MNLSRLRVLLLVLLACAGGCQNANSPSWQQTTARRVAAAAAPVPTTLNPMPVIHVYVALCDNVNQGIVPVSASLGNGDNPATNLYWGAAFGVKAFFSKSSDWQLVAEIPGPSPAILDRCIFKHKKHEIFLIADAYRGKEIAQATWDFLEAASGGPGNVIEVKQENKTTRIDSAGSAELLVYIGHDGLMDFTLKSTPTARDERRRRAIILACASKQYFSKILERTGATPLLWTTNLMAPEAYILSAALDGWISRESDEQIRMRAAQAYNKYQHCGLKAANNLFSTGW